MAELPTATAPSTTSTVPRALQQIEAAKLGADPDVAACLDAIGDLVRITGQPSRIFEWVATTLRREHLRVFAARSGITLHESRATDEDQAPRAFIVWAAEGEAFAIIPAGQDPATTLLHLREEIAIRAESQAHAAAFQAAVNRTGQ